MQEKNNKVFVTVVLCILSIGFSIAVSSMYKTFKRAEQTKQWPSTVGEVVKTKIKEINSSSGNSSSGNTRSYKPVVFYSYQIAGRDYTGRVLQKGSDSASLSWAEEILEEYPVGKEVDVFYNPYRYKEAVLITGSSGKFKFGFAIFSLAAVILIITSFLQIFKLVKKPSKDI